MTERTLDELFEGELDGTNSPGDQARLAEILAGDESARERFEALRRAIRALDQARREESPPNLVEGVMREIRERTPVRPRQLSAPARVLGSRSPEMWSSANRRPLSGGGSMSTKKVLLGVAAVAVIAIGYFAITGWPPVGPGTEGTVGAAQRYRSEQIAGKDVQVESGDLQAFMQSELFHKLMTDESARKAITAPEVQAAFASAAGRAFLASQAANAASAANAADASSAANAGAASYAGQAGQASNAGAAGMAGRASNAASAANASQAANASSAAQASFAATAAGQAFFASQAGQALLASQAAQSFFASQAGQAMLASAAGRAALASAAAQASVAGSASQAARE
jgi:hypothetical protein